MLYSQSTGGFYTPAINGNAIPPDAVEITPATHAALLAGQSTGRIISADANGSPVLTDPPPPAIERQIAALSAACAESIRAGFISYALGALHHYPSNDTDQRNLIGSVLASTLPGIASNWTTYFWCADHTGGWAFRPHTAAQIQQVGLDAKEAILTAQLLLQQQTDALLQQP